MYQSEMKAPRNMLNEHAQEHAQCKYATRVPFKYGIVISDAINFPPQVILIKVPHYALHATYYAAKVHELI